MTRSLLLLPLLAFVACADAPADETAAPADETAEAGLAAPGTIAVGETVPDGATLTPAELTASPDQYAGKTVVVEGVAREVCQQAGCWLTFSDDDGRMVRVSVPHGDDGYPFTFPKDASGKRIRVSGTFAVETTSVDDLRHYAEDDGASQEEIAAITEPEETFVLTALGAEVADAADEAPGTAPA